MGSRDYRISVKGVVVDSQGRFLLAKNSTDSNHNGEWELLGGGVEHEEHPIDALKREVFEETGLRITEISRTPIYFITAKKNKDDKYIANIVYEIRLNSLKFIPSEECIELRFFNKEETQNEPLFEITKKFIEAFSPSLHNNDLLAC